MLCPYNIISKRSYGRKTSKQPWSPENVVDSPKIQQKVVYKYDVNKNI